jgi:hypothetical protein
MGAAIVFFLVPLFIAFMVLAVIAAGILVSFVDSLLNKLGDL